MNLYPIKQNLFSNEKYLEKKAREFVADRLDKKPKIDFKSKLEKAWLPPKQKNWASLASKKPANRSVKKIFKESHHAVFREPAGRRMQYLNSRGAINDRSTARSRSRSPSEGSI